MEAILGITFFVIDAVIGYKIYHDSKAKELSCKKMDIINFITLWVWVAVLIIARFITSSGPSNDWLYVIVSFIFTITFVWFVFMKDFYIDLNRMPKDRLPYSDMQNRFILKTYIRNIGSILFLIIQVAVFVNI